MDMQSNVHVVEQAAHRDLFDGHRLNDHEDEDYWLLTVVIGSGRGLFTGSNLPGDLFCLLHTYDGNFRSRTVASSIVYNTTNPTWPSNGNGSAFVLPVLKQDGITLFLTIWDASESFEEAMPVGKVEIDLNQHLQSIESSQEIKAEEYIAHGGGQEDRNVECVLLPPEEFKVSLTTRSVESHDVEPTLTLQLGRANVKVKGEPGKVLALRALLKALYLKRWHTNRNRILDWETKYEDPHAEELPRTGNNISMYAGSDNETQRACDYTQCAQKSSSIITGENMACSRFPCDAAADASEQQAQLATFMQRLATKSTLINGSESPTAAGPWRAQAELLARLRPVSRPDGEAVLRAGTVPKSLLFIRSGAVVVHMRGKEVSRIEAGQFVGEIGLLLGKMRVADVWASGPVEILELDAEDLWLALDLFPGLYNDLKRFALTNEARRKAFLSRKQQEHAVENEDILHPSPTPNSVGSDQRELERHSVPEEDNQGVLTDVLQRRLECEEENSDQQSALRDFQLFLQNVASRLHAWLPAPPRTVPRSTTVQEAFGLGAQRAHSDRENHHDGDDGNEDLDDLAASFDGMSGIVYTARTLQSTHECSNSKGQNTQDPLKPAACDMSAMQYSGSPYPSENMCMLRDDPCAAKQHNQFELGCAMPGISMVGASFDSMSGIEDPLSHYDWFKNAFDDGASDGKSNQSPASSNLEDGFPVQERQDQAYNRYVDQFNLTERKLTARLADLVLSGVFDAEPKSPSFQSPTAHQNDESCASPSNSRSWSWNTSTNGLCPKPSAEKLRPRAHQRREMLCSLTAAEDERLQPLRGHIKDAVDGAHLLNQQEDECTRRFVEGNGGGETDWSQDLTDSATSSPASCAGTSPSEIDVGPAQHGHSLPTFWQYAHQSATASATSMSVPNFSTKPTCSGYKSWDANDVKVHSVRKRFRLRFRRAFDMFTASELGATARRKLSLQISDVTVEGLKHRSVSCYWTLHDGVGRVLARSSTCRSTKRMSTGSIATSECCWGQQMMLDLDEDDLRTPANTSGCDHQDIQAATTTLAPVARLRLDLHQSRMMLMGGDTVIARAEDLRVGDAVARPGVPIQHTSTLLESVKGAKSCQSRGNSATESGDDKPKVTVTITVTNALSLAFQVYVPALIKGSGRYAITDHCGVEIANLVHLGRSRSVCCSAQGQEQDYLTSYHEDSCGATATSLCSNCEMRGWSECVVLWDAGMRRRLGSVCVDVSPMKHARARLWDQNDTHFATIRALSMPNPDICAGVGFKIVPTFSELSFRAGNILPVAAGARPSTCYYVYKRTSRQHLHGSHGSALSSGPTGSKMNTSNLPAGTHNASESKQEGCAGSGQRNESPFAQELVAEIIRTSRFEPSYVLIQPHEDAIRTLLLAVGIAESCRLRPRALPPAPSRAPPSPVDSTSRSAGHLANTA